MKMKCLRIKLWFVLICGLLFFSAIFYRLYVLQIDQGAYFLARQDNYKYVSYSTSRRNILDRHNEVLATNSWVVEATLFMDNDRVIEITDMSSRLGFFEQFVKYLPFWKVESRYIDLGEFNEKLKSELKRRFSAFYSERVYGETPVLLLQNLPLSLRDGVQNVLEEQRERYVETFPPDMQARVRRILRRHVVQNFRVDVNHRRSYLYERTASHVLGYMNVEGPQRGAEYFLDPIIAREEHRIPRHNISVTSARTEETGSELPKGDISLTIDLALQQNVENILQEHLERVKAPKGFAIVMDPHNGEILALANYPNYNPEEVSLYYQTALRQERFRNLAREEPYEPGSILKVFPLAAALEEEITDMEQEYDLKNGYWYVPEIRKQIRDSHPREKGNIEDILKYSSNIGLAKIAMEMGQETLYDYLHRFQLEENYNIYAFNQQTLSLPRRRRGIYPLSRWSRQSIAMVSLGHEVSFTGIQLLSAFNALINGGIFYSPRVIDSVVDSEGNRLPLDNSYSRRIISTKTSDKMRRLLDAATEYHEQYEKRATGSRARFLDFPEVSTGGKTGTAQYFDRDSGTYHSSRYISSFMGFFPVENPRYTILVSIFFPAYQFRYGGESAAPVFRDIGEMILSLEQYTQRGE